MTGSARILDECDWLSDVCNWTFEMDRVDVNQDPPTSESVNLSYADLLADAEHLGFEGGTFPEDPTRLLGVQVSDRLTSRRASRQLLCLSLLAPGGIDRGVQRHYPAGARG